MKELIECKDLRYNQRVIAAAIGMGLDVVDGIVGSLADLAFEIRDALVSMGLGDEWFNRVLITSEKYRPAFQTHRAWIIAATLAWESKHE